MLVSNRVQCKLACFLRLIKVLQILYLSSLKIIEILRDHAIFLRVEDTLPPPSYATHTSHTDDFYLPCVVIFC